MLDCKVTLGVGPSALPALPVAILPAGGITAPCGIDAAIGHLEAFDIAPDGARKIGIGRGDDDFALLAHVRPPPRHAACICAGEGRIFQRDCIGILDPHIANDPRQRIGVRVRPKREVIIAEHMRPGDPAVLGCPVGVDVARGDVLHPKGLHRRADGFGAEGRDPKPGHVIALKLGEVRRIGHDRLEEGHARLEDRDVVPLDHRGKAARVREHRRALRDEARHPGHQRRADQVALPRDPARIGHNEQRITGARVKAGRHRLGHAGGIAVRMDDSLGLARRAGGVDEEHRIIGIDRHRLGRGPDRADEIGIGQRKQIGGSVHRKACAPRLLQHRHQRGIGQLMAPTVALLTPYHVGLVRMAANDHRFHARWQGNEAGGNRDPHAGSVRRADPAFRAEIDQRPAHAAHHVRTVDGNLTRKRLAHGIDDGGRIGSGQTHVEG